jgi:GT2 family glycosyltransferase
MTKITAIITTYRRPIDLARCLEAFTKQIRPVDEVVVVVRDTDNETWERLETIKPPSLPIQIATVIEPGAIAALNKGLETATGDIICITDDDGAPHPDWLKRIEAYFLDDSEIGAVGGRDWVYQGGTDLEDGAKEVVGKVQWFGRVIGNHHLGVGKAREVDVVKGVNMSYRRQAIIGKYFDQRMKGSSAQIHFEIEFCLSLKKSGWKIIYDPAIAVNHYPGKRFDEDKRHQFNPLAQTNIAHNETLALLQHLSPIRKIIFMLWAILIGTSEIPGFVQLLRFIPKQKGLARKKFFASVRGRFLGWQTWLHTFQQVHPHPTLNSLTLKSKI